MLVECLPVKKRAQQRLGEDMHISLPPSAYVMKVQLPQLQEPKSKSEAEGEEETQWSEKDEKESKEISGDEGEDAQDDAGSVSAVESTRFRMARHHKAAALSEEEARAQRYKARVDSFVEERCSIISGLTAAKSRTNVIHQTCCVFFPSGFKHFLLKSRNEAFGTSDGALWQDTYREHGLDLRAVLQVDLTEYLMNSSTLCRSPDFSFFLFSKIFFTSSLCHCCGYFGRWCILAGACRP